VYFPDETGHFNLPEVVFCTLVVEGTTASGFARNDSSFVSPQRPSTSSVAVAMPPPPLYKSIMTPKKQASVTIRIFQARLRYKRNKPEFTTVGQLYVEVTESTANINCICEAVRSQCGAEYTIVTAEGFEIMDSPATRGINN